MQDIVQSKGRKVQKTDFLKRKKYIIKLSQSILLASSTVWAPVIHPCISSDSWKTLQAQTENTVRVVENLTPVQKKLLAESNQLNEFFPHIGIFSKDYYISSLLIKK
jgi:hypothetical protein